MSVYSMLYDYQKNIVDKFKDRSSYGLFLDMGLGKTPLAVAFAEKNECTKVLVITINGKACETIETPGSWQQWSTKSNLNYVVKSKKDNLFLQNEHSFLVVNYEALFERIKLTEEQKEYYAIHRRGKPATKLKSNIEAFIDSCKHNNVALIIDESHKIKDESSSQAKAIRKIKTQLSLYADKLYSYLLTGTPFTTEYIDLYAQLKFLGCPMNKGQFKDNFCEMDNIGGLKGWQQPIKSYKNLDQLYKLVHQYAITIKSEDVVKLPEKIFNYYLTPKSEEFDLLVNEKEKPTKILNFSRTFNSSSDDPESSQRLQNFLDEYLYSKEKNVNNPFYRDIGYDPTKEYPISDWMAETSGAFWMRAREISIGFCGNAEKFKWYNRDRLEQLKKLLSEHENNYVLFYNYTPELIELFEICSSLNYNIDVYSGEIKSLYFYEKYSQQSDEERFTNKKNIILANFASGSTGMNWQLYNQCIIASLPVYKDWEQGLKRVHRTGQKNTVIYHVFYQKNWLDSSMLKSLQEGTQYTKDLFEDDLNRVKQIMNKEG